MQLATPDERALPSNSNARLLTESLRHDYPVDASQAVTLVARGQPDALTHLAERISLMDHVVRVDGPIGTYEHGNLIAAPPTASSGASYAFVYLSVDAQSDAAQHIVRAIRAVIGDQKVEVGGPTANLIDSSGAIAARLPLAIALMAGSVFVLLFLFTGSVVVPIKALLLNMLVLSAVLGVMVWVFQDGHLAAMLGVTPAPLNLSMVVLLCCIAFSLSVDYEIFLLSRIKEARDSGLSNDDAIVAGLGRVGRIITSAALLLTITLVSFANGLSFMKMFGIGTALAIVIDATVIRGVVVPAFLRFAGEFNWWAPRPLRLLHGRIGLREAPPVEPIAAPTTAPDPHTHPISRTPVSESKTVRTSRLSGRTHQVEVIPGGHVVANVDGTVIVVAHRLAAPISPESKAAQQILTLVRLVQGTDRRRLASAISLLTMTNRALADFAIVVPTGADLDVYLYGAVTAGFDNGAPAGALYGAPGRLRAHRRLPVPAVGAVVTVDEAGLPPPDRRHWTGVYTLAEGTVPGRGAVLWTTRPASAALGAVKTATTRIEASPTTATTRISPLPQTRGT